MIIAIDFDNTITEGGEFPTKIGTIRKGCREAIADIRTQHKVIVWTSRVGEHLDEAVKFLEENGIEYDALNDNIPSATEPRKVYADVYIDNKNIFCSGIDWNDIRNALVTENRYKEFEDRLKRLLGEGIPPTC